jgi:16S rRNA (uracil1498-N3)-methyltransferase
MRISRIFTDQPLEPGGTVTLDRKSGHYLAGVLRLRLDDPVVLFNGDGSDYAGSLVATARSAVEVKINSRLPAVPESGLHITLAQAISRGERMDYTLQKCTELGVAAFRPVFTKRVEVRLAGQRLSRRLEHWRAVLRAACAQAGRAVIPDLHAPVSLDEWLSETDGVVRFMLDGKADAALTGQTVSETRVELLVGPEGGLSGRERRATGLVGVKPVTLGPRVLRTETAGPAGVAVLQALGGDF